MPEHIIKDAVDFYTHKWEHAGGFDDMHEILSLPPALRVQVFFESHANVIELCGFLQVGPTPCTLHPTPYTLNPKPYTTNNKCR
jgi:hypothetical protein